ncbi:alpha/beta hydrolase [Leucobacter luti]|uniref:alpha/beta hydrolase n=1 Tax=Leucobacter luti TaxID=340320 RepID=UPI001F543D86|nr:alpha/beta hydrolase [Leucobacter luti]
MSVPARATRGSRATARAATLILAALAAGGLSACDTVAAGEARAGQTVRAGTEEATMRITDVEVAGPADSGAAGGAAGSVDADAASSARSEPGATNRLGSERVRVREYEPALEPGGRPWATLVWAHGGSFSRGTLDWPEADWVSRQFAEAGIHVYSVDYGLVSDTVKAPAPSRDLAAAFAWVAERAERDAPLVLGGASAGAHLATLAALDRADLAAAGAGRPADALILEYPTLHRVQRPDAAIAAATAELPEQRRFDPARIAGMYEFYLGDGAEGEAAAATAVAGELPAERLGLLPPTTIVNADADELRASGEQFAEQLRAAGVPVAESIQPGTVHGYMNRPEESASALADAEATIDRFVAALRGVAVAGGSDAE